jgi:peptidoglycan/xylan/chitin deacetylase (PgdA/CDA1 family)
MLRGLIKSGVANALRRAGAGSLTGRLGWWRRVPLILGYHRVVERFSPDAAVDIPPMLVSGGMLREHLEWVGERFRFLSLDEIGARMESGEGFDHPSAAVTFDDGYADLYHNAFPILRSMGIPGAVFVVTGLTGTTSLQIHDRLYIALGQLYRIQRYPRYELAALLGSLGMPMAPAHVARLLASPFAALGTVLEGLPQSRIVELLAHLERPAVSLNGHRARLRPLEWEMIAEMRAAGFAIGSHTRTHALLTNEEPERVADELTASRLDLEEALGGPVRHFAYPDGRYDASVVRAVLGSGYRTAYTTCRHRDPRHPNLTVPRKVLWERSCVDAEGRFQPAIMECQINGMFDLLSPCAQDHDRLEAAAQKGEPHPVGAL